jgi:hypothetical protein
VNRDRTEGFWYKPYHRLTPLHGRELQSFMRENSSEANASRKSPKTSLVDSHAMLSLSYYRSKGMVILYETSEEVFCYNPTMINNIRKRNTFRKSICIFAGIALVIVGLGCFYLGLNSVSRVNYTPLSPLQWGLLGFSSISVGIILVYLANHSFRQSK